MDNPMVSALLSGWLLPPANALLLLLAGLLTLRWRRRLGITLICTGTALLYASSAPFMAGASVRALELAAPAGADWQRAQAIVVLGGGSYVAAPEYGGDTLSGSSLERVRYAALLQHRTGLPVLTSGGKVFGVAVPEAEQMRAVLERELGTPVRWVEPGSTTTWTNATASRALLSAAGVRSVALVTHAWHMRRAQFAFEQAGFEVIPAPTGFATHAPDYPPGWMPTANALETTRQVWREVIGIGWYRLRAVFARPSASWSS